MKATDISILSEQFGKFGGIGGLGLLLMLVVFLSFLRKDILNKLTPEQIHEIILTCAVLTFFLALIGLLVTFLKH
jgi:hypothetical protein